MKCNREQMLLYAVTDRKWTGKYRLYEQVEQAILGGAGMVQLREKGGYPPEVIAEAKDMAALCRRYGVPFLINDSVEVCLACGADGVHLGQDDMTVAEARRLLGESRIIGVSAHNVEEALAAEAAGADYLGSGAAFATGTKSNVIPLRRETLCAICAGVSIPVVAIGGIHKGNMPELSGTGIAGVALVQAIFGAKDIEEECRELKALAAQCVKGERE